MKSNSTFYNYDTFFKKVLVFSNPKQFFLILIILGLSINAYAQKDKDIIPTIDCIKYTGNGIYQASFGYENPTKKEVVIDENGSIIKSNNGKKVAKGLNKFNPGKNTKVFTKEFSANDYVVWEIISNGNPHEIVVNANAPKCGPDEGGFLFPVYGQGNGKSEDIIGQELTALADGVAGDIPSPLIFQITDDKVLIEIVPVDGEMQNVISLLQGTEFGVPDSDFLLYDDDVLKPKDPAVFLAGLSAIDVYFPISRLVDFDPLTVDLNDFPDKINFVRPLYPARLESVGDILTGNAVSQGDAAQTTDIVRKSFKLTDKDGNELLRVDGTGITIGVMSNSYNTQLGNKAAADVGAGDLPGDGNNNYPEPVDVLMDYPYGVASDEGRAMMHIIHDVAPGAKLAFHAASLSPRNFEAGFKALAEVSDIIVDDITFITEPFFGEGRISAAIKAFSAAGGIHFTSAGNFADDGYQSNFSASSNVPTTNFIDSKSLIPTIAHVFGTNSDGSEDYLQKISVVPGTYMIVLQWRENAASQDNLDGALTDLDIYIVDDFGRLLVGSNRVNIAGDPTEVIVFKSTGTGEANILITSGNGATTVPFRYIAFQSNGLTWEYDTPGTSTVSGHAMNENSVTVGAIRFNQTIPETFSSFGGTLPDGSPLVDFAAPDGVNTNVLSIGTHKYANGDDVDGDIFKNFFGTSAAAPSAAAAVALLQSALPTWYPSGKIINEKGVLEAIDVIKLFKDNVRDGSIYNEQAGAGMIDANKVFNSLASKTARITSFTIVNNTDGTTPIASAEPVTIKIIGDFFPAAPLDGEPNPIKIYLNKDELIGTGTIQADGSIEAIIPPFSGNPDLKIYTNPKEGSQGNGGFSDPYKFFQDGKIALTVIANPADTETVNSDDTTTVTQNPVTILYGQEYKSKLTYHVKGIPDGGFPDSETFEDIFPDIVFTTNVDNEQYPSVYNYSVTPSFDGQSYDESKYIVNFKNGDLVVKKNYLTIKPEDKTFKYGDIITNTLVYQVTDEDGTAISETEQALYGTDIANFYTAIGNAHKEDFYYNDFGEGNTESLMLLINDFNQNSNRYEEIATLLENGGWISSLNSILNGLIRQQAIMNEFRQSAVMNELRVGALMNEFRVSAVMNEFRQSAIMNTLRIDKSYFTNYIDYTALNNTRQLAIMNDDWIANTDEILNEFRQSGVMNDFRLGAIMNDMRVGAIMNALDVFNLNVDVMVNDAPSRQLGIMNDLRQLGVMNELRVSAVINEMRQSAVMNELRVGAIMNDKVFSLIDYTDAPYEDDNEIQKFYSLNLITGVDVTNGVPHLIFPGAFLNDMAANFYIHYENGNLAIEPGVLSIETKDFSSNYGAILTDKDIPTTFTTVDTNFELIEAIFPEGIPYYFEKVGGDDTKYTLGGPIKMEVGVYNIFITDVEDNYTIAYGDNHGTLTITEATLTVVKTTAPNIKYGGTPEINTSFDDSFADGEGASDLTNGTYYFMNIDETDTTVYELGDKMDVGEYNIFINDDPNDNYKIEFAADRGTLTVEPATLTVTTTAFEVGYGDSVRDAIEGKTLITGFAEGEGLGEEFDVFPDGIPYLFNGYTTVTELGSYLITVETPSDNYVIDYGDTHGTLTITEATLIFDTQELTITYGATPNVKPNFKGFGNGEDEDVLVVDGKMPYYFMPGEYKVGDKMDVGKYDIFITDNLTDNYKFSDTKLGTLTINKATLYATIFPEELIVNQGDTPALTAEFTGFVNEVVNDVFPSGIPYYFEDEFEDIFPDTFSPGVFTVRITDPLNYVMAYNNKATLFVNPFNDDIMKVRIFADCVSNNGNGTYKVTYRYENDNAEPVFVALGADNNLSGPATLSGTVTGSLPTIFMQGKGTFEIGFNGEQLIWSLTTYEGTHKSSVSSASTSGANVCDAKLDGAYTIAPNPVVGKLTITQTLIETSWVYVYNMYGIIVRGANSEYKFDVTSARTLEIDMNNLTSGSLYVVRIQSENGDVRSYNIIKQ